MKCLLLCVFLMLAGCGRTETPTTQPTTTDTPKPVKEVAATEPDIPNDALRCSEGVVVPLEGGGMYFSAGFIDDARPHALYLVRGTEAVRVRVVEKFSDGAVVPKPLPGAALNLKLDRMAKTLDDVESNVSELESKK